MFVGYIPTEPNNLVAMTTKNTNGLSCEDKESKQQGMTMSVCKHWATAQNHWHYSLRPNSGGNTAMCIHSDWLRCAAENWCDI